MKKWLIRLSIALNVVIICVAMFFWFFGSSLLMDSYMKPTHERWISQFDVLEISPGDIVFLGDSITEGGIWEELFPALPVRNRGISGDVTEGVLQRLDQVVEGKPASVFLLIGTNDLGIGELSIEQIAANIETIVDTIGSESPGTQVYVQSVLPRATSYREQVEALNAAVEDRIGGKATWVDLYPLFLESNDGSIRDDLSNDELHLLGEGYVVWRDAISPYLSGQDYRMLTGFAECAGQTACRKAGKRAEAPAIPSAQNWR